MIDVLYSYVSNMWVFREMDPKKNKAKTNKEKTLSY